ncbi:hypothetical protein RND81_05G266100 [Saponaria officinalis]|uniref:HTH myb-type domain-containing protein n=1 Tax=Saponaria officinalis TaxID=3572 RepID=A0AAW1L464_SAPOF
MGEVNRSFNGGVNGGLHGGDDSERVHEWEAGLPNFEDITPLSHGLIPAKLLSAFNITPEPYRTSGDVAHASQKTISSIRGSNFNNVVGKDVVVDELLDEDDGDVDDLDGVSAEKKHRRNVSPEDADSAAAAADEAADEKAAKRARLVWTPQLHKRFVEVVAHLGIKNAVPKTIMQLMNVEGLTRENVASHLQKYRLYLKRNQGFSFDNGQSNSSPEAAPPPMMHVQANLSNNHQNHHQNSNHQFDYNQNNYTQHHQYQFSNGVMQTGNSNMYGSVASYHQNHHLNHNYPPHVAPGEQ